MLASAYYSPLLQTNNSSRSLNVVMPSSAFQNLESNLMVDVDRIIGSHRQLNHDGRGRRGLGHITRGGMLMLCAAWEVYLENLLIESVGHLAQHLDDPKDLPKAVQKELARSVKNSKHELKPLELAGDGWCSLYRNHASEVLEAFNTPKSSNVDATFRKFLGIKELSSNWTVGPTAINDFVADRGAIAHGDRDTRYVTIVQLTAHKATIVTTSLETDNYVANFLRDATPTHTMPWRRRL